MFVPNQNASKCKKLPFPQSSRHVEFDQIRSQQHAAKSHEEASPGRTQVVEIWCHGENPCLLDAELTQWKLPGFWPMLVWNWTWTPQIKVTKISRYCSHVHFGCGLNMRCHVGDSCVPFYLATMQSLRSLFWGPSPCIVPGFWFFCPIAGEPKRFTKTIPWVVHDHICWFIFLCSTKPFLFLMFDCCCTMSSSSVMTAKCTENQIISFPLNKDLGGIYLPYPTFKQHTLRFFQRWQSEIHSKWWFMWFQNEHQKYQ